MKYSFSNCVCTTTPKAFSRTYLQNVFNLTSNDNYKASFSIISENCIATGDCKYESKNWDKKSLATKRSQPATAYAIELNVAQHVQRDSAVDVSIFRHLQ